MSKYHIRTDGSIGICRAKEGKCPYTVHIKADTVEQAQIKADAIAYKNQQEELKKKFGDNVPTMDALLDSDGVREQVRSSGIDVDTASRNIRRNIFPKSHFDSQEECDDAVIKSLQPEELESRIKKDTDELETMLESDIPELNKKLDINNYKQKG
jgi:hypothetical protein